MALDRVRVPRDNGVGLTECEMMRLGNLVCLVGPNGAGKSRLLQFTEGYARREVTSDHTKAAMLRERMAVRSDGFWKDVEIFFARYGLRDAAVAASADRSRQTQLPSSPEQNRIAIEIAEALKRLLSLSPKWQPIQTERRLSKGFRLCADFPPKEGQRILDEILAYYEEMLVTKPAEERVSWTPHRHVVISIGAWAGAWNPWEQSTVGMALRTLMSLYDNRSDVWDTAKSMVRDLLGAELSVTTASTLALDGRPIDVSELSPGQRVLLSFVAGLLSLSGSNVWRVSASELGEAIVLIDDFDAHLHPAAQIQLLKSVRKSFGNKAQIWLSTHSPALVAHIDEESIWYVHKGEISPPSSRSHADAVLSLLGSEENWHSMWRLYWSPRAMVANHFLAGCLLDPGVSEGSLKRKDPQTSAFVRWLDDLRSGPRVPAILDVGAGKGRFAQAVIDTRARIMPEYVAIEPNAELHKRIEERSSPLGLPDQCQRCYENCLKLPHQVSKYFDVAILCNVLHEIPADLWSAEIHNIAEHLRPDGYFLICEDLEMPHGELPHAGGFVTLDGSHFGVLFAAAPGEIVTVDTPTESKWRTLPLLTIAIPAKLAMNVTRKTVRAALGAALKNARGRVQAMRHNAARGRIESLDGHRHALDCQIIVNTSEALHRMKTGPANRDAQAARWQSQADQAHLAVTTREDKR